MLELYNNGEDIDIQNEEDKSYIDEAKNLLYSKIDYIENYNINLEKNIGQAKDILNNSLYSDKTNFSRLNVIKYVKDMSKLKNAKVVLFNTIAIEKFMKFNQLPLLTLVMILVIVLCFAEEMNNGMIMIVRGGRFGRLKLAIKRCIILFGLCVFISAVINFIVMGIFVIIYGKNFSFLYPIQSSEMFKLFPYNINILQSFLIYIMCFAIGMYAIGMLIYMLITWLRSGKLAMFLLIGILIIEYILYTNISSNSSLCILRYLNLFCMILPNSSYMVYENWGYNGFATGISDSTLMLTSVIIILSLGALIYIVSVRYNEKKSMFLRKIYDNIVRLKQSVLSKCGMLFMELYKSAYLQKGFIILIIILYLISCCQLYRGINYSDKNNYLTEFYNTYEGCEINENIIKYIDDQEAEINEIKNSNSLSGFQKKVINDRESALNVIKKQVEYIQIQNDINNQRLVIINPDVYNDILGERNFSNTENINLLCVLGIIFVVSSSFSFERKSGMITLGRTCLNRSKILNNKIKVMIITVIVVTIISNIINWRNITQLYSLKEITAPIQSLAMYEHFPIHMNILCYLIVCQIIKFFILLCIGFIVLGFSMTKGYIQSIALSLILLLGHLLYIFKIPFMKYLSIVVACDFNRCWIEYGNDCIKYMFYYFLLFIAGCFFVYINKKWNYKWESKIKNK